MPLNEPRTNFLFWNIQKKPITQNLVRLAESHDIHILMLAETAFKDTDTAVLENALNDGPRPKGSKAFSAVGDSSTSKVQIFSRLKNQQWTRMTTHDYYDIWSVVTNAGELLYLAAVHFPSIQADQGDGQRKVAMELRVDLEALKAAESGALSEIRIIVCGDFNANPFDPGICGIYGLNANLSREIVQRSGGSRILHKRRYSYLYNPMWRLFAGIEGTSALHDQSPKIYGTYYNSGLSKSVDPFWYTLDQVMVSRSLLSSFRDAELRVATQDAEQGGVSFVSPEGIPKSKVYSDHLPIIFRLQL
jgi:exonuclease III